MTYHETMGQSALTMMVDNRFVTLIAVKRSEFGWLSEMARRFNEIDGCNTLSVEERPKNHKKDVYTLDQPSHDPWETINSQDLGPTLF